MAFNLQGGFGAGGGADMLQQILRQKAMEAAEAERVRVNREELAARTAEAEARRQQDERQMQMQQEHFKTTQSRLEKMDQERAEDMRRTDYLTRVLPTLQGGTVLSPDAAAMLKKYAPERGEDEMSATMPNAADYGPAVPTATGRTRVTKSLQEIERAAALEERKAEQAAMNARIEREGNLNRENARIIAGGRSSDTPQERYAAGADDPTFPRAVQSYVSRLASQDDFPKAQQELAGAMDALLRDHPRLSPAKAMTALIAQARDPIGTRAPAKTPEQIFAERKAATEGNVAGKKSAGGGTFDYVRSVFGGGDKPAAVPAHGSAPAQSAAPKVGDTKTYPNGRKAVWDGQGWLAQ